MQAMERQMVETAKQSVLLALFNKLDDHDKDAVIQLSESLVAKHKSNDKIRKKRLKKTE